MPAYKPVQRYLEQYQQDNVDEWYSHVYQSGDSRVPFTIFTKWYEYSNNLFQKEKSKPSFRRTPSPPAPWVSIGDLYVTLFESGCVSWGPLIKKLYDDGARKFVLLTGRHGDPGGTYVAGDKTFQKEIIDSNHTDQDKEGVAEVLKDFKTGKLTAPTIEVLDVCLKHNSIPKMQGLVKDKLNAGEVVIAAWCYSFYSFFEAAQKTDVKDLQGAQQLRPGDANSFDLMNESIVEYVQKRFDWVPGFIPSRIPQPYSGLGVGRIEKPNEIPRRELQVADQNISIETVQEN